MGGFFPKLDEKYGDRDRDREYNWWGCSNLTSIGQTTFGGFENFSLCWELPL